MKIETLKKSHLKRNIIIGVVVVLIISAVILQFTKAKYRVTQSIPLVNGTINYTLPDLNVVAITVDGVSSDTLPEGNYDLLDTSYCTYKDGSTIEGLTLSYDSSTKAFSITPYTTNGTKCYLNFETATTKKVDTVLGTIAVNLDTPNFSKTAQASCSSTSTCEETNGIYEGEDDDGTTYYWRGAVDNNWVRWAKDSSGNDLYWRIIRINGDGTIRLIYAGTDPTVTTGTGTQISTSAFNTSRNNNMYVGYMYTSGSVHGLGTSSTIKGVLDTWYTSNLASYANDIDTNAGFCGDRTSTTSSSGAPDDTGGTGTTATYYGARYRLYTNKTPTFSCSDAANDLYTISGASQGNKALTYPIGLITADEVAYAGGLNGYGNSSYYLYTNQYYWTMSPFYFDGSYARVFAVYSSGFLNSDRVNGTAIGVRPVINLKADVTISSGNGSASSPYVVS